MMLGVLVLLAARAAFSAASLARGVAGSLSTVSEAHLRAKTEPATSTGARDRLSALQRRSAFRDVAQGGHAGLAPGDRAAHPPVYDDEIVAREEASARRGHEGLTKKQLNDIYSIKCLQEKQRNPNFVCEYNGELEGWHKDSSDFTLSIGSFPKNIEDRRCNSYGEFFCDPQQVLKDSSARKITEKLGNFKDEYTVNCANSFDETDPFAAQHSHRNFNLAVVIVDEWPSQETDAASLQKFGLYVMGQWGLMPMYNGVDTENSVDQHYTWNEYYENCPNAAALILLPRHNEVFLSSPSCEFICSSRGGPEVKAAAEHALVHEGVAAAIEAAIKEVGQALHATSPLSIQLKEQDQKSRAEQEKAERRMREFAVVMAQRAIIFLMAVATLLSVPCSVYVLSLDRPKAFGRMG